MKDKEWKELFDQDDTVFRKQLKNAFSDVSVSQDLKERTLVALQNELDKGGLPSGMDASAIESQVPDRNAKAAQADGVVKNRIRFGLPTSWNAKLIHVSAVAAGLVLVVLAGTLMLPRMGNMTLQDSMADTAVNRSTNETANSATLSGRGMAPEAAASTEASATKSDFTESAAADAVAPSASEAGDTGSYGSGAEADALPGENGELPVTEEAPITSSSFMLTFSEELALTDGTAFGAGQYDTPETIPDVAIVRDLWTNWTNGQTGGYAKMNLQYDRVSLVHTLIPAENGQTPSMELAGAGYGLVPVLDEYGTFAGVLHLLWYQQMPADILVRFEDGVVSADGHWLMTSWIHAAELPVEMDRLLHPDLLLSDATEIVGRALNEIRLVDIGLGRSFAIQASVTDTNWWIPYLLYQDERNGMAYGVEDFVKLFLTEN